MSDTQNPRPEDGASLSPESDSSAMPTSPLPTEQQGNSAIPPVPPIPPLPSGAMLPPAAPAAASSPLPPSAPSSPAAPGGGYQTPRYPAPTGVAFGHQPPVHGFASPTPVTSISDTEKNDHKASGALRLAGMLATVVLVGGAAGFGGAYLGQQFWSDDNATTASQPQTFTVNNPDAVTPTTAIAGKVLPSVVTLEVTGSGGTGGSGSGVILSADGYILTNAHVVTLDGAAGSPKIRVTTSDGKLYDAKVVGIDPIYDLAVVKLVDASGLTPIEFADSSRLNVGDTTVAVGAPLGLKNTVTTGIVSALNRSISIASSAAPKSEQNTTPQDPGSGELPFLFDLPGRGSTSAPKERIAISVIQTDAAINPGNSGGALVNSEGKLIGINVAIATAGGNGGEAGSIGVGFSIPSNIAQRVSKELIENGAATHGLLGATVQASSAVSGSPVAGAYIKELTPGGPAEKAGLREGDIVTSFNGSVVGDQTDLTAQVRAVEAGGTAELSYVRAGQTHTAKVTLGTLTSD